MTEQNSTRDIEKEQSDEEDNKKDVEMINAPSNIAPTSTLPHPTLGRFELIQIIILSLCFCAATSSTTLTMTTAPLIYVSTGGSSEIAPITVASFVICNSLIMLFVPYGINRWGRKQVFALGIFTGFLSSLLGALAVLYSQPILVIFSGSLTGIGSGLSYGYRFAAIEVSPIHYKEFAVTTVMSGGILTAFLGPLLSTSINQYFPPGKEYVGTYVMNAVFVGSNALLLVFYKPFEDSLSKKQQATAKNGNTIVEDTSEGGSNKFGIKEILLNKIFLKACFISSLSWVCMILPMSLAGLAMKAMKPPLSHRAIEWTFVLHFLGMFLPGFVLPLLSKQGVNIFAISLGGVILFVTGMVFGLLASPGKVGMWMASLFFVGAGWNFGFNTGTVYLSTAYDDRDHKSTVFQFQSYHDFICFMGAGVTSISFGFVYTAAGGNIEGWKFALYINCGFIGILCFVIMLAWRNNGLGNGSCVSAPQEDGSKV